MGSVADSIEEWLPIKFFEDRYLISDSGRVKCIFGVKAGTIKSPSYHAAGYPLYSLYRNGKATSFPAHKLVALHFIGDRPDGMFICHKDGNPLNNHVSNLTFASPKKNQEDRKRHGTYEHGSLVYQSKLDEEKARQAILMYSEGKSQSEIAALFKVHKSTIGHLLSGKNWVNLKVERPGRKPVKRYDLKTIANAKWLILKGFGLSDVMQSTGISQNLYYRLKSNSFHKDVEARELKENDE